MAMVFLSNLLEWTAIHEPFFAGWLLAQTGAWSSGGCKGFVSFPPHPFSSYLDDLGILEKRL